MVICSLPGNPKEDMVKSSKVIRTNAVGLNA